MKTVLAILTVLLFTLPSDNGYVRIKGYLYIDSLREGTATDSVLVIRNSEILKKVNYFTVPLMYEGDFRKLKDVPAGFLVFSLSNHKLFIYTGYEWEMVNSMQKVE